jgi:hypothetical protein
MISGVKEPLSKYWILAYMGRVRGGRFTICRDIVWWILIYCEKNKAGTFCRKRR